MVLVPVAGNALQRHIFEPQRMMAFLARYNGVPSYQRKSRNVVIERRYAAPIVLAMACLAPNPELALVLVILAMTRHASCRQLVAIEIAGVAVIALGLDVCAP
jgi:hypothetical protein